MNRAPTVFHAAVMGVWMKATPTSSCSNWMNLGLSDMCGLCFPSA